MTRDLSHFSRRPQDDNLALPDAAQSLIHRFSARESTVAVIGLGYVGLPLALSALSNGHRVIGIDTDDTKIEKLHAGYSYLPHIDVSPLTDGESRDRFLATSDPESVANADAIIICVPTPLGAHHEPDLSFVESTVASIEPHIRPGHVISLESSTYPGTTEEIVAPMAERRGLTVGEDVYIVYSPEREDPGNLDFTTRTIPKVVGGMTDVCRKVGTALYESLVADVVSVSSPRAAEMTKLLENTFRAVNIGLVNELKLVAERLGINIWEVIAAASTKPFGFMPFYPGPGLGGHCIPIDPFYLTWKAREVGINTRFVELAGEINRSMPDHVVSKVASGLNEEGIAVRGANVLLLGLAYKKNVGDVRESPAVEIAETLLKMGARVSYSDPFVASVPPMRQHDLQLSSIDLAPTTVDASDCVVLVTDHDAFDYQMIQARASLIVDTRGRFEHWRENVVKA